MSKTRRQAPSSLMHLLENERMIREHVATGRRVAASNYRILLEEQTLLGRHHYTSLPLEHLTGIEEQLSSNPLLLAIGLMLIGLGWYLTGPRLDGATVILALGGVFCLIYLLSRRRGVEFRSAGAIIFLSGGTNELAEFIWEVEQARFARMRALYPGVRVESDPGEPATISPLRMVAPPKS